MVISQWSPTGQFDSCNVHIAQYQDIFNSTFTTICKPSDSSIIKSDQKKKKTAFTVLEADSQKNAALVYFVIAVNVWSSGLGLCRPLTCQLTWKLLLWADYVPNYTVCEELQAFAVFQARYHRVQQCAFGFGHSWSPTNTLGLLERGKKAHTRVYFNKHQGKKLNLQTQS